MPGKTPKNPTRSQSAQRIVVPQPNSTSGDCDWAKTAESHQAVAIFTAGHPPIVKHKGARLVVYVDPQKSLRGVGQAFYPDGFRPCKNVRLESLNYKNVSAVPLRLHTPRLSVSPQRTIESHDR